MKNILIIVCILIVLGLLAVGITSVKNFEKPTLDNQPNSAEGAPVGSIHNLPVPQAVSNARVALATRLNIDESKILILEAKETEWSDSCLGLGGPAESCLQVITPGYNIVLQVGGKEYRYRTDASGDVVRAEN